jgi:hypothetical protein
VESLSPINLIQKIISFLGLLAGVFTFGYLKGKSDQKTAKMKNDLEDAIQVKKRQTIRNNDSVNLVNQRLQEFIRDE